jgi:hypothetical protein
MPLFYLKKIAVKQQNEDSIFSCMPAFMRLCRTKLLVNLFNIIAANKIAGQLL